MRPFINSSSRPILTLLLASMVSSAFAGGNIAPQELFYGHGREAPREYGDFISADNDSGLDSSYFYYVEVPPGTSNLTVDLYDGDVNAGTESNILDRDIGDDTTCTYSVHAPSGTGNNNTAAATQTLGTSSGIWHNQWRQLYTVNNPANGHWQIRVTMGNSGQNFNGYGIRAHDGDPSAGGRELNVYAQRYFMLGINDASTRTYTTYPYITSGCNCFPREFDADDNQTNQNSTNRMINRTGTFDQTSEMISGNNVWRSSPSAGYQFISTAAVVGDTDGYGIWRMVSFDDGRIYPSNYIPLYISDYTNPAGSTGNPSASTTGVFRTYLPRDGSTSATPLAPAKPFLRHYIHDVVSGPNPPASNQDTDIQITVEINNPTLFPITFSTTGSRLVTSRVPSTRTTYRTSPAATVTQGSITAQPSNGGTGTITWNPGTVAAGTTARMTYTVRARPTSNNQNTAITGTPGGSSGGTPAGTTALYLDETGNNTQTNLTLQTLGQLCQLQVRSGGAALSADVAGISATALEDGTIRIDWETATENENLGFNIHDLIINELGQPIPGPQINAGLIPADTKSWGFYTWTDLNKWDFQTMRGYFISDVDLVGTVTYHGPVYATVPASVSINTSAEDWQLF